LSSRATTHTWVVNSFNALHSLKNLVSQTFTLDNNRGDQFRIDLHPNCNIPNYIFTDNTLVNVLPIDSSPDGLKYGCKLSILTRNGDEWLSARKFFWESLDLLRLSTASMIIFFHLIGGEISKIRINGNDSNCTFPQIATKNLSSAKDQYCPTISSQFDVKCGSWYLISGWRILVLIVSKFYL